MKTITYIKENPVTSLGAFIATIGMVGLVYTHLFTNVVLPL